MRIDVAKCINVLQNAFVNLPSLAFMLPKLLSENPASFLGIPRIYIENSEYTSTLYHFQCRISVSDTAYRGSVSIWEWKSTY